MIKVSDYAIQNLSKIKKNREYSLAEDDIKGLPSIWKFHYVKDRMFKVYFDTNYHICVVINNEIPNHDEILNRILKIFKETL